MTSIELLFNKLWEEPKDKLTWNSILEEAKEMHKSEILAAFTEGADDGYDGIYDSNREQYYQETFVSKGSDDTKEESKQETLEEAAESLFPDSSIQKRIFIKGAKWYREQLKTKL
jgi:hypothetical protein